MLRYWLIACGTTVLLSSPAPAQIRKFPYQGVVESDAAYVRSGPGKSYYPTQKLSRGTRLTVHRHDPGGWYMIAPPEGSFSWIRAEYVKTTGPGRGLVTQNNVVVRTGSSFGDDTREIVQVQLSKNDQVRILEEKMLSTPAGPVKHFKIAPPVGDYRWISGKFITPIDQIVQQQHDQNPFSVPTEVKKSQAPPTTDAIVQNPPPVFESSQGSGAGNTAVRRSGPDPMVLASQRERLEQLDQQFRAMVNGRTEDWNFASLEQGYQQLQQEAALPAIASQINLRFAAIHRYQRIKGEYDDLVRLTKETRQRDAQLMSIQKRRTGPMTNPSANPEAPPANPGEPLVPIPDPFASQPNPRVPDPVELPGVEPIPQNRNTAPAPNPQRSPTPAPSAPPRFDGAGIVQRAAAAGTGTPAYVLITPQGRVLAYLQPTQGVNLESYVGKAMGIYGQRSYRQDLRLDVIVVRSLTPVRLAP